MPPEPGVGGLSGPAVVSCDYGNPELSGKPGDFGQWMVQSVEPAYHIFRQFFHAGAVRCVLCLAVEHTDHNWNSLMTAPVPVRDLYWSKFLLAAGVAVLGQVCIGVLYLLSGQLAGVSGGLPLQLAGWMFFGALGGMAVCAVQLFLSLVIRSFAPPVALGLVGGIAGLVMTSQGAGLYCPYSLLCLGMRANNPNLSLEVGPFVLACGVCIALFSFLTIRCMAGRDVTTG